MWTQFHDMRSGGGLKEAPYTRIYIEAPEDEAKVIFYNRFGHNPNRVSCTCCGSDYSIDEYPTLAQASAFKRGCDYAYFRPDGSECPEEEGWKRGVGTTKGYTSKYVERPSTRFKMHDYQTLAAYRKRKDVLIIPKAQITSEERRGSVPKQGYVWVD